MMRLQEGLNKKKAHMEKSIQVSIFTSMCLQSACAQACLALKQARSAFATSSELHGKIYVVRNLLLSSSREWEHDRIEQENIANAQEPADYKKLQMMALRKKKLEDCLGI